MIGFLLNAAVGCATGVLSGFGIGGGSILMLYFGLFTSLAQRTAQGINLLYFIACAPAGLYGHLKRHLVCLPEAWFAVLTGLPASVSAAWLASILDPSLLRRLFGALLLYTGIHELLATRKSKCKNN